MEHGKLSPNEDMNQSLKTWKVPENGFTQNQIRMPLRQMLHSAGLTVHGFPGTMCRNVPALLPVFNGQKPANTAPIRVDLIPDRQVRYSGGGVTIEQQPTMAGKAFRP